MTDHPWWQRDLNIISEAWSASIDYATPAPAGGFLSRLLQLLNVSFLYRSLFHVLPTRLDQF
ncbi:hypothetical protein CGRA01v4_05110 [Colletotrichum graminicola]|nr:hypothetical protein CGRA01v4_05110 [Colletotrichum graminicola]